MMKIKKFNYSNQPDNMIVCDYRDDPKEVMNTVNDVLTKFGLEVIMHNDDSDTYIFSIENEHTDSTQRNIQ